MGLLLVDTFHLYIICVCCGINSAESGSLGLWLLGVVWLVIQKGISCELLISLMTLDANLSTYVLVACVDGLHSRWPWGDEALRGHWPIGF